MSSLFISHSSRDNEAATELKARLEEKGHRSVFLDLDPEKGIQAGVSWERTLYTKLRSCRAVVALCSDNYLASQWCFAEIALARMEGKELFALMIDPWGKTARLPSILSIEQYIDLRTDPEQGYQRLWNGFEVQGIVPEEHRTWAPGQPPYPGLRAFDETDAPIFFGRDTEVREGVELLNRVRRQGHPRLVMVLGSSGSGKSSLARAGIAPQLRRDKERWLVVGPFRPGRQPGRELALALSKAFEEAGETRPWRDILARLRLADDGPSPEGGSAVSAGAGEQGPTARERLRQALLAVEEELTAGDKHVARSVGLLKRYLEATSDVPSSVPGPPSHPSDGNPLAGLTTELRLARGTAEAKVVLLIDQFEELLGHEEGGADHPANRFLGLLKEGIESDDNPPLALGTMRSDFLGMLQRSGPLRGVGFKSLSVGPMSDEGMRRVVEQPALLGQIDLEDELTHRLLRETGTSDALPLLAFTLRAMWDRFHETRRFDVQGYEALGGLQGAIAQVADDTLEAALAKSPEGTEKDLRITFLSLARPAAEGSGWARQPASWDEMPERVRPIIQQFIDQRLLVKRADGTVEVAHEALFRSWETLRGWLNANAEGLHLRREIRIDAEKWEGPETDEAKQEYLWRGGRLARALELRHRGVLRLTELDTAFVEASERDERRLRDEEEARRQAELEQARRLAEEQRQRAEERARSVRNTRRFAAGVAVLAVAAATAAVLAYQAKVRAADQGRIAVASEWMSKDPTRAALVLLELRKPDKVPRAVQLMSDALGQPLALLELRGHTDSVSRGDFSRAGDRIVTSSEDGTARVWNADGTPFLGAAGEPTVLRHVDQVNSAVFSPDGGRVLTACADGKARLWSFDGIGTPVAFEGHTDKVTAAAFNPAGDRIVTASDDGTARVWDVTGRELIALPHGNEGSAREEVNDASFDGSGNRIVTATQRGMIRVWDAKLGTLLVEHKAHDDSILSVAFGPGVDPDGRGSDRIVTAGRPSTARVWKIEASALTPEHELAGHRDEVYGAALSPATSGPSAGWIVTASRDSTTRIWRADGNPVTARAEPVVLQHVGEVNHVAFNATGDRMITTSKDATARVWSLELSRQPRVLPHALVTTARFDAEGEHVLTASGDGVVRRWAADDGGTAETSSIELTAPRASADGVGPVLERYPAWISSNSFDATGDRLVTGSGDRRYGTYLMTAGDKTARVWTLDWSQGEPSAGADPPVLPHPGDVVRAVSSPDGERVATASEKTARIWRVAGGEPVVLPHPDPVLDVAFHPGAETVVVAAGDKAWVWDAAGKKAPAPLAHPNGPQAQVTSAAFSPTGDRIVMTGDDGTTWVWSADGSGDPVALAQHERGVETAAFSHDGRRIVTGSRDATARVSNADASGEPLVLGKHGGWVVGADFDRDGARVVTTSNLESAQVWSLSWRVLGSRIRSAGGVCLDPAFRQRIFDEDSSTAAETHRRCRECTARFRARSAARDGDAFDSFRGCFLPAF